MRNILKLEFQSFSFESDGHELEYLSSIKEDSKSKNLELCFECDKEGEDTLGLLFYFNRNSFNEVILWLRDIEDNIYVVTIVLMEFGRRFSIRFLESKDFSTKKYRSLSFRIMRHKKSSIPSGFWSMMLQEYEVIHNKSTYNSKFDLISINFNEDKSWDEIKYLPNLITDFFSLIYGNICYFLEVEAISDNDLKIKYFKHKYSTEGKVMCFDNSERFIVSENEDFFRALLKTFLTYNFSNSKYKYVLSECILFQKKSLSTPEMHYKDIFSFTEELSKEYSTKWKNPKLVNELRPILIDNGIKEDEVDLKVKILFDDTAKVAITTFMKEVNAFKALDFSDLASQESIVKNAVNLRNRYSHSPMKQYSSKKVDSRTFVSFIVFLRESLVLALLQEIMTESNCQLIEYYNIDNLLFIDKTLLINPL